MSSQLSRYVCKNAVLIKDRGFLGLEYGSFLNKAIPLFAINFFLSMHVKI